MNEAIIAAEGSGPSPSDTTAHSAPAGQAPLIELRDISQRFGERQDQPVTRWLRRHHVLPPQAVTHALDHVDLAIMPGEVVGLVGESGCGKSTLGRIAAGLLTPSAGEVRVSGKPLAHMNAHEHKAARLAIQMIFQDPYSSLNPRRRVGDIVGEAPRVHALVSRTELPAYVAQQLRRAGLDPAAAHRYPHQFSGGQRQRIGIARALAVNPAMLVCDESVAALDVSIQAQVLNLFIDLREQLNLTYLFISHDLGVVEQVSDRVVIMYLGRVVESGPVDEIFSHPNHPYTQTLLAEIPRLDARKRRFTAIRGEMPSPLAPPGGCHFHPRCAHAMPRCKTEVPRLRGIAIAHQSACHLNDAL